MRAMMRGASFTRACVLWLPGLLVSSSAVAQTTDPGRQAFVARCAGCHGSDGNGGELGPGIAGRMPLRSDEELAGVVRHGRPAAGMPAFPDLTEPETAELIRFLRTLRPREGSGPSRAKVALAGGRPSKGWSSIRARPICSCSATIRRIHLLRKERRAVPRRDVAGRLAELQRPDQRQPVQPLDADRQGQRRAAGAEVDLQPAQHVEPAGDAGCRRRRDVCHQRERVLRARRRQRPPDLALPASANQGPHRQRRRRRQPRRRRRGRPRLHGHRPRASHRPQSLHRRAAVGNRDGGLAPELQRHRRAAVGRQPGRHRHGGRRRRRARIPGGVRSEPPARKSGASGPCRGRGEPGSETWQGKGIEHPGAPPG